MVATIPPISPTDPMTPGCSPMAGGPPCASGASGLSGIPIAASKISNTLRDRLVAVRED
jgi:hypothetical protein